MLNEFRSTSITWDKATRRIYSPVTANGSDSNGRKLNIQVVNSGQVENLTGATLHLYWETKDKTQHGLDAFTASDISKGEFEIFYTTGMLSNVGELNATLVLVDATGRVVSDWFKITVTRGIDDDAIQSENSFTTLTQALIDISNLEQKYAPRLNDLTAQLQQTTDKLDRLVIDPTSFGLEKGGDYTLNQQAIMQAIDYAEVGETVHIPAGVYGIDDTIIINKDINFIMDGDIVFHGLRDRPCLHFKRPKNVTIKLNGEVRDKDMYTFHGWENDNYVGVVFENAFRSRITVNVIRNFTVGLQCLAAGGQSFGFFFNTISIYQLIDNRIQFENKMKDPNSWFNSNIFTDIFFTYTQSGTPFQTANVDRYGIKQTHENNIISADTNIFKNIRFDLQTNMGGTYTGIYLTRAWEWLFEKYRTEIVSDSNAKFAVLNAETNQIRGLKFDPLIEFYKVRENIAVDLINVSDPKLNISEMYTKTGKNGNSIMHSIFEELQLNLKYRSNATDYHFIKSLYRTPLNVTTLSDTNEISTDYSTANRLINNGVEVGSSFPIVLYLKNIKKGDTIEVNTVKSGDLLKQPAIRIKPFINNQVIENNELIENGRLIKTIIASNSYWDRTGQLLAQSVNRSNFTFSVNTDEVETVAIYVYGGLNGISVKSTNTDNTILKSLNPFKNNSQDHCLPNVPTKKIDGKFKPFESVYKTDGTGGWVLDVNDTVIEWKQF